LALSRRTGAAYLVPVGAEVRFERQAVSDGEVIETGSHLSLRVTATPGHTFHHVSYALAADGQLLGMFSGGSLLFGSVGRTDLVAPEHTETLAHVQYASAHRMAEQLPGHAAIYPTHGCGSFRSAAETAGDSSTIAAEARSNPALTQDDQRFVADLLAGLDASPAYYVHMSGLNAAGPEAPDLSPTRLADPAEQRRRLEAGELLVDLRHRQAFAAGRMRGSLNFGIDGKLATYLGWPIPWATPVTLLGEGAEEVAEAQRELARIGINRPAAAATGTPEEWAAGGTLRSFCTARFADLAAVLHDPHLVVLDVRRNLEWADSHIPEAVHIPLHELPRRLDEVPDKQVCVHCASGHRASVAASILDAADAKSSP
jgi:hydroxyacylglutathione hydrolase